MDAFAHYDDDLRLLSDAVARQVRDAGDADAAWTALVAMGLPALGLPEAHGGAEADGRSFHAVMEVLGRHGVNVPFLGSAMGCTQLLLRRAAPAVQRRWLDALAGGAALALAHDPRGAGPHARREAGGWRLDGRHAVVPHGGRVQAWIVSARTEDGAALFLLDEATPGLRVERCPLLDGSQGCDLWFDGARCADDARLGEPGAETERATEAANDWTLVGQCAESVGLQAALLAATLDHVKTRRQFGAPIGSFQVVQHRLADMLVALEQARSLAWAAAVQADQGDDTTRRRLASAAKVRCVESGRFIGLQAIQLHGGMGMTDELPVGRHVKRLLAIEHTLGDQRHHLARLAALA
ncbi:acyl-CoA dehydrogenase family protein [Aquabacterium sp. J223]|uniref:acyl-CoA dehydrogenase family protein n=1 Tax=Aquabacterium sp. J223 TaxID=2898431 RepID=UPI0021AE1E01|nr:acyl-CoA dehydrogenase family protein [Aquabacterium sp. J223]UUX97097.1 acyl-CoA dehydrogenase family protein [Aquabacterium sp. J223]